MVEVDVVYEGDLRCKAVHGPSQDVVLTDAPVDNEGKGEAFSPTDLVGTAMATCMLTIMGILARKKNIDIKGTKAHVTKEMIADPKRRIKKLEVTITFPKNYTEDEKTLLENGAYSCPVHRSLHPDVEKPIQFVYPA